MTFVRTDLDAGSENDTCGDFRSGQSGHRSLHFLLTCILWDYLPLDLAGSNGFF